jgi:FHA domain
MLVMRDGASRRVGPNGVLIGRQADCDLVASDPALSRRHALVRVTSEGAEVLPLGRGPVEVNGTPHDRARSLADGDEIAVPGLALRVELAVDDVTVDAFVLERDGGAALGIGHTPFRIGGAPTDDVILAGWPPSLLVLHLADGRLFVESAEQPGELRPAAIGERIACRGEAFTVTAATTAQTTAAGDDLPSAVEIELLPRGGLVLLRIGGSSHTVFLADRRLDLVIALLQPPPGHRPGEFIGDEVVSSIVWPRADGAGRTEINVLISRCRRDLVEAGLNGARIIQRAPGGGGTRFALGRDATVTIKQ